VPVQDSRRSVALQAALQFVSTTSDIPSDHKVILIDVLAQALREDNSAELSRRAVAQAGAEWQEHEITHLKSFMGGRLAKSWQHADEGVMQLAAQLRRWITVAPRRCGRPAASRSLFIATTEVSSA
jgi:hypothetical protein